MANHPVTSSETVLEVENLSVSYRTRKGDVPAVRDVSFALEKGETLGIAGESGCGKSTVAFAIPGFLDPNARITSGRIRFEGKELIGRTDRDLRTMRGNRIGMVYQDPMQALNPSLRIGDQLTEVLTCHHAVSKNKARLRSIEMLKQVHMPDAEIMMRRYPHQISGGQQQRVVIAMAMLNRPDLLILDEPTTALDVTVEAAVLDLVEELQTVFHTAIVFITHNLGVIARVSHRIAVMYAGEMVEQGPAGILLKNPGHPYTLGLLNSIPRLGKSKAEAALKPIPGHVRSPETPDNSGCRFEPRCDCRGEICGKEHPELVEVSRGHQSRCFFAGKIFENPGLKKKTRGFPDKPVSNGRKPLLDLENFKVRYPQNRVSFKGMFGFGKQKSVRAVEQVDFSLEQGQIIGIVGESGCGKSTLARGIVGLEPIFGGKMEFKGIDITMPVTERGWEWIREIQMVFQNPDSTLNPFYTIGAQIARPIKKFKTVPRDQIRSEVLRLLDAVGMGPGFYDHYPRQLSGGEKQRVGIARALACRPELIVCDEPVSSLDVSVQASVINLLLGLVENRKTALILISHDLSVVRHVSDMVAVMYLGRIVEKGPVEKIYAPPHHPYTEALLSAVPVPDPEAERHPIRLQGDIPSPLDPPKGCVFHTRCSRRKAYLPDHGLICETVYPPWVMDGEHEILCHIPMDVLRVMK